MSAIKYNKPLLKFDKVNPVTGCIAIGVGAQASEQNELCIRVHELEGRTILTDEERDIFFQVLKRIEFRNTLN